MVGFKTICLMLKEVIRGKIAFYAHLHIISCRYISLDP